MSAIEQFVDRVAKAILQSDARTGDDEPWKHLTENQRDHLRSQARAAIREMLSE